jgi:hypothetical protein
MNNSYVAFDQTEVEDEKQNKIESLKLRYAGLE